LVLLAVLLALGLVGARLVGYSFRYARTRFNPASLESAEPTFFYLDWSRDLDGMAAVRARLGADGVFRSDVDAVRDGKLRHDPLTVIQMSLGIHDQLLEGRRPELDAILRRQLDWLLGDGMVLLPDSVPVWPQYYRIDRYGLHDRWISALTQGQAISLLTRAAAYTGRREYLDWATRAARAFTDPGLPIVWHGEGGAIFFEEYPCVPPAHVLNGCLLAWLGLWDCARARQDTALRAYCLDALERIGATLPRYERGDWTRYDLQQDRPASPDYQEIHAALAETMARLVPGDPRWRQCALRWRRAADDPVWRCRVFFEVAWDKLRTRLVGAGVRPKGLLFRGSPGQLPAGLLPARPLRAVDTLSGGS
jgi:hypothetical protein